jgi:hypothetical protein
MCNPIKQLLINYEYLKLDTVKKNYNSRVLPAQNSLDSQLKFKMNLKTD